MAFNFLERLGSLFGGQSAAPAPAPEAPAETPAEPAPEAVAEAPAAEAYTPETPYTVTEEVAVAPAEAVVVESYPEPAPAAETPSTYVPPISMPTPQWATEPAVAEAPAAEPVAEAAPVAEAPPTPAEPLKSAEELEEERLWGEIDAAWGSGDFAKVTELLDALKVYQPEDAAAIDEKIAAAQYNQASALEQNGELDRALYLYQEAQRRNPNLGEAQFAIERVQAALAPPAEAAPEPAPEAAPAEQTYTVADGDTLSAIAERYYGDANQWPRIFEANTDQLDNPDVIQPGQTLRIPA